MKISGRSLSLILLLFVGVSLLSCGGHRGYPVEKTPKAEKGLLDLSGWDLDKEGVVTLDGEWECYWKELLDPADFSAERPHSIPDYINLPGTWKDMHTRSEKLKDNIFATYRLLVRTAPSNRALELNIPFTYSPYKVWVNGQLLAYSNLVESGNKTNSRRFLNTVFLDKRQGDMEVVVQTSDFFFWPEVVRGALRVGSEEAISRHRRLNITLTAFLSGALLITGLYHLSLFLFRRKDRASLYFCLFCLMVGIYTIVINEERLLAFVFPAVSWELYFRLTLFIYIASVPVFSLFLRIMYPAEIAKKVVAAAIAAASIFFVLAVFSPDDRMGDIDQLYNIVVVVVGFYLTYALINAAIRKREGALMAISGGIVLYAAVTNDILYGKGLSPFNGALPAGVFCFIISYSSIMAKRISGAFSLIEKQENALQEANVGLEVKVRERTASLEKSVREKEVLLREVHHRVKNNMQVIVGLLNLQSDEVKEKAARSALIDSKNRIKSMMLIHEKLYNTDDLAEVNFGAYIEDIASDLFSTFGADRKGITYIVEADGATLDLDSAIPCGLIINELLTNSLKHAFKDGSKGVVTIKFEQVGPGEYELRVADNGVGLPLDFNATTTSSLGMRLVTGLVQKQLKGEMSVKGENGAEFIITFRK